MKIALFGGSFNPIHKGHMQIANELIKRKIVDEVWLIPCGNHAFNKKLVSGEQRIKMINLAIGKNSKVKVSDYELKSKNKSYAAETIAWFKKEFADNDFYFIIGADNLTDLDKWHDFEYLTSNVRFILIKRPGFNSENKLNIEITYVLELENNTSSTQIRENLTKGISVRGLIAEEVEEYISKEGIYVK